MDEEKYNIDQIKKAFWKIFHESGEIWFDYQSNEKDNNNCTNSYWIEFKEELERIKNGV